MGLYLELDGSWAIELRPPGYWSNLNVRQP
jgi:hypothetical protein